MQRTRLEWVALVASVTVGVWAVEATAQMTNGDRTTTPQERASGQPDRSSQPTAERGLTPGTVRASKITGMNVYDQAGNEKFGTVKDILIDPSANRVEYAVLSTTKAAGVNDRYVAVPWTEFSETRDGKDLAIDVDKDRLAKAPSFDGSQWPNLSDRSFWERVSSYFGTSGAKAASQAATQMRLVRANDIIGKNVENRQNQSLGKIEDVVYELRSGRVRYGVLAEGGVLGLGSKYVAIPLNAFGFSNDNSKLVLNADKDRLAKAPGFDKNNWPSTATRQFDQQVTNYWGSRG